MLEPQMLRGAAHWTGLFRPNYAYTH
jgi:hypothetical protein